MAARDSGCTPCIRRVGLVVLLILWIAPDSPENPRTAMVYRDF